MPRRTLTPQQRQALEVQLQAKLKRPIRAGLSAKLLRGDDVEQYVATKSNELESKAKNVVDTKTKEINEATQQKIVQLNERLNAVIKYIQSTLEVHLASLPEVKDGHTPTKEEIEAALKPMVDETQKQFEYRIGQIEKLVKTPIESALPKDMASLEEFIKKTAPKSKPIFGGGGGPGYFFELLDVPNKSKGLQGAYADYAGLFLRVTGDGKKLEWAAGGGGASAFTDLTDTPASYTGQGGTLVAVKGDESGLEFIAPPSGSGDVIGPGSSVDDNIALFNGVTGKIIKDGGATIAQVRDRSTHTGTQTASTISDFQTTVSANTDVAANTAARHAAVTLAGTPDYITISGQVITRNQIDLTADVTGDLPFANLAQLSAHSVLARAGSGTGDVAGITMGNNTILGRSGSGDVDDLSAAQVRTILNVADGATANTGTVTSVAATVPTGLTISGSPITGAGTLAIGLDTGRVIPLQTTIDAKVGYTTTTTASSAAPTPTGDAQRNELIVTALAENCTVAAPTGTPAAGNMLKLIITASGGTRTVGYNAALTAGNVTRTTSVPTGETLVQVYQYQNAQWVCAYDDLN
jgi:hypothetical protein